MYQVQQIVGKRMNQQTNTLEYRVKWVNYPPEDNTWEPQRNLKFVKNLIEEFNKKCQIQGQLGVQFGNNVERGQTSGQMQVKSGNREQRRHDDSDDGHLDDGVLFFQEESDQQQNQRKSVDQEIKQVKPQLKPQQKSQQKPQSQSKTQPKPQQKPSQQPPSSSSRQPLPSSRPPPPSSRVPPPPPSYSNNQLPKQKNKNLLQKIQETKKMPLLPPDFTINKQKYISPSEIGVKNKNIVSGIHKSKQIEKIKNRSNNVPMGISKQYQFQPMMKSSKIKEQVMNKMGFAKNTSRVVPPPPPPPSYSNTQPIFQQNYFSNQYQVYNTSNDFLSTTKVPPPPPPSFSYPQSVYTLPSSNYDYTMQNIPSKGSKAQPSYLSDMPDYGQFQSFQPLNSTLNHQPEINGYQCSNEDKLQVFEVLSMEKINNGFTYLVQTSQGRKWVSRQKLLPQYCMLVLEFYERHLTFQD